MPDVIVFITIVASQLTQLKPTMFLTCVIWDQFNDNFDALWLEKKNNMELVPNPMQTEKP